MGAKGRNQAPISPEVTAGDDDAVLGADSQAANVSAVARLLTKTLKDEDDDDDGEDDSIAFLQQALLRAMSSKRTKAKKQQAAILQVNGWGLHKVTCSIDLHPNAAPVIISSIMLFVCFATHLGSRYWAARRPFQIHP